MVGWQRTWETKWRRSAKRFCQMEHPVAKGVIITWVQFRVFVNKQDTNIRDCTARPSPSASDTHPPCLRSFLPPSSERQSDPDGSVPEPVLQDRSSRSSRPPSPANRRPASRSLEYDPARKSCNSTLARTPESHGSAHPPSHTAPTDLRKQTPCGSGSRRRGSCCRPSLPRAPVPRGAP